VQTDLLFMPMGASASAICDAAVAAEAAGFDGAWTWDHLRATGGEGPTAECWTTLTAVAARVPRIAVGPLVLNVINRHPGVLANMAATLQELSGGRLILGIGAGGGRSMEYAREQLAIGQPVESDRVRAQRVIEAVQVIKRLWGGDTSAFEGRHYRLDRPSGYLRPNPLPSIVVGAFGARMADVAGRYGDGLNTQAGHPQLRTLIEVARKAREASGRDPAGLLVTVFAGLSERWLTPASREREAMESLGVERLILLLQPPFDAAGIADAGRLLRG